MSKERTIYVLVGVPLCGKSTYAEDFVKNSPGYKIVSRDSIRLMIYGKDYQMNNKDEEIISNIQKESIHSLLDKYNVIIDNTHLKISYIRAIIEEYGYRANIIIKEFSTPERNVLDARNRIRNDKEGKFIPEAILDKFIEQKRTLELAKYYGEPDHIDENSSYYTIPCNKNRLSYPLWNDLGQDTYIFDLDGTLADGNGRDFYSATQEEVASDLTICPVVSVALGLLSSSENNIIFVSGREDKYREATISWIEMSLGISKEKIVLYMRQTGDHRSDYVVKKEIYNKYIKDQYHVMGCFDDRNCVIDKCWLDLGLFVFDVGQKKNRF